MFFEQSHNFGNTVSGKAVVNDDNVHNAGKHDCSFAV
jgi:hypothetical protein